VLQFLDIHNIESRNPT